MHYFVCAAYKKCICLISITTAAGESYCWLQNVLVANCWADSMSFCCTVDLSSLFDSCIGFIYRIRVYLALRMQFSNSDSRSVPHRLNFFTHAKVRHFRIYNSATVGDVTCLPAKHETFDCFHFKLSQLMKKKSENWIGLEKLEDTQAT